MCPGGDPRDAPPQRARRPSPGSRSSSFASRARRRRGSARWRISRTSRSVTRSARETSTRLERDLLSSELFEKVTVTLEEAPGGVIVVAHLDDKHSWIVAPTLFVLPSNFAVGVGFAENNLARAETRSSCSTARSATARRCSSARSSIRRCAAASGRRGSTSTPIAGARTSTRTRPMIPRAIASLRINTTRLPRRRRARRLHVRVVGGRSTSGSAAATSWFRRVARARWHAAPRPRGGRARHHAADRT